MGVLRPDRLLLSTCGWLQANCSISYQAIAQRCIPVNPEAEEAFKYLKQAMVSILILSLPDFCKPFILETDAFGSEVATVLTQGKGLVAYFSQTLSDSAQRKSMYEQELMAIVLTVQKWHHYLL